MPYKITLLVANLQIGIELNDQLLYSKMLRNYKHFPSSNKHLIIYIISDQKSLIFKCKNFKFRTDFSNDFDYINFIIKVIIEINLLDQGIILLHGSALGFNRKAYIFLGKSGAGKSTIIQNSTKTKIQCEILADDTVVIQKKDDTYFIYSSPFDYKSDYSMKSQGYPLQNIYILNKANKVSITSLPIADQAKNLMYNDTYFMFAYKVNVPRIYTNKFTADIYGLNPKPAKINKQINTLLFGIINKYKVYQYSFSRNSSFTP